MKNVLGSRVLMPGRGRGRQRPPSAMRKRTPSGASSSPRWAAMPAWEKARQFQFDFVVVQEGKEVARFAHVWDRYTGDYRVTGVDKAGAPYAVSST